MFRKQQNDAIPDYYSTYFLPLYLLPNISQIKKYRLFVITKPPQEQEPNHLQFQYLTLIYYFLNYKKKKHMNSLTITLLSKQKSDSKTNVNYQKTSNLSQKIGKKRHHIIKRKKQTKTDNYHWTALEHQRYINFLVANGHLFDLPYQQKIKLKIQVMMSNAIQQRNSTQCRSHHQKMLARFGSVQNIIKNYQQNFRPSQILKSGQVVQNSMLHLSQSQIEQRVECKIEQPNDNIYIQMGNSKCGQMSSTLKKEQEQLFYKTFV